MQDCFLYQDCNHKNCNGFCPRKLKSSYLLSTSMLPESKWQRMTLKLDSDGTDLEAFKVLADIEAKIVNFVAQGASLFIHSSNSGNGKTSWAIRLLQSYVDKTWNSYDFQDCAVLFVNVPRFLESIKANISSKDPYAVTLLELIPKADLVVWDDIAAKIGSDYEVNKLLSLIDGRIANNKANIYTSNLNNEQIYQALGSRLASRICNGSINLEFFGADKRYLGIKTV